MRANTEWRRVMNKTHFRHQPSRLDKSRNQAQRRNPSRMAIGRHNHLQTLASQPMSDRGRIAFADNHLCRTTGRHNACSQPGANRSGMALSSFCCKCHCRPQSLLKPTRCPPQRHEILLDSQARCLLIGARLQSTDRTLMLLPARHD